MAGCAFDVEFVHPFIQRMRLDLRIAGNAKSLNIDPRVGESLFSPGQLDYLQVSINQGFVKPSMEGQEFGVADVVQKARQGLPQVFALHLTALANAMHQNVAFVFDDFKGAYVHFKAVARNDTELAR